MTDIAQCCRILGARPGAGSAELKQAYRDLVKIWHPDRFQGDTRLQHKARERSKNKFPILPDYCLHFRRRAHSLSNRHENGTPHRQRT
ncbi:MAG: J domain-containing protein [Syntrophobacteraceae bacterium]|jgi:hypothetical protein